LLEARNLHYFSWVIPGSIIALGVLFAYLKFLFNLPLKTKLLFIISGTIFIGGTVGMELVGGIYLAQGETIQSIGYAMITTIEEFLEMMGIVIFIYALINYLNLDAKKKIMIHIQD
jgi:hypothetical protein